MTKLHCELYLGLNLSHLNERWPDTMFVLKLTLLGRSLGRRSESRFTRRATANGMIPDTISSGYSREQDEGEMSPDARSFSN